MLLDLDVCIENSSYSLERYKIRSMNIYYYIDELLNKLLPFLRRLDYRQ
jgi:hypothetical protein